MLDAYADFLIENINLEHQNMYIMIELDFVIFIRIVALDVI